MELAFLLFIVVIVAGSLIYLTLFYQPRIRNVDLKVLRPGVQKRCAISTIRGDTCLQNEYRPCSKVGSYEQCTNNVRPASKCVCSNQRGFEVCDAQISDRCYMDEFFRKPDLNMEVKYSDDNSLPRVNRHSVEMTPFDEVD